MSSHLRHRDFPISPTLHYRAVEKDHQRRSRGSEASTYPLYASSSSLPWPCTPSIVFSFGVGGGGPLRVTGSRPLGHRPRGQRPWESKVGKI